MSGKYAVYLRDTGFADVDLTISTSGNLEYVSMTTSKYCPLRGVGP